MESSDEGSESIEIIEAEVFYNNKGSDNIEEMFSDKEGSDSIEEMFSDTEGSDSNEVVGPEMFEDEEVKHISGFEKKDGYVEVACGITTPCFGDFAGKLRVFANGDLEITCKCHVSCLKDRISPGEFVRHSGIINRKQWKNNIWVIIGDEKVPLSKTKLLKYYNSEELASEGSCHRDEFVQCSLCKKMRRFHLRNKDECRRYHDALANVSWKCSYERASCDDDDEERGCRRAIYRGCLRSSVCSGCETCVCFGCKICRFQDCNCRTCADYYENADDA